MTSLPLCSVDQKLYFYKENDETITLTFAGENLTGATVYFTAKTAYDNSITDSTAVILKDVTSHSDPTNGRTVITLTSTDTNIPAGEYVYDIKLKKASNVQMTVKVGELVILPAVTNRG